MTKQWENLYEAALLETDWSIIEDRIKTAEIAIHVRLDEFSVDHGGTLEENRAIADALNSLDLLRREVVAWRESKPTD